MKLLFSLLARSTLEPCYICAKWMKKSSITAHISLNGDWSPSDVLNISSLSGYHWHDRETFANDDAGPKSWRNNDYTDDAWQFTQETTATWLWSEENEATVGGYFLMEERAKNLITRLPSVMHIC